jgi:tetratricopeptide (TPR) repeat protein
MTSPRLPVCVLAAAVAAAAVPREARAIDLIIGGRAEQCSKQAKAGLANPLTLENCTMAITGEPLWGYSLAATYVNRGTMYLALRNWGQAIRDFDDALAIQPDLGEAFVNRGGALIGMKRYAEAVSEIDRGLALNPEEPEKAYGNRAIARWSLDDIRGAYQDFMKAHELKPEWTWPVEQLANFRVEPRRAR